MALTQGIVIKLILKYIGGTKIRGNGASVIIENKKVVVKAGAGGGLSSAISNLTSQFSNITDLTQGLVQNPLGTALSGISDSISNITDQISSLTSTLPTEITDNLSSAISSLTSSVTSFSTHTDILSGLITDQEAIGEDKLSLSDITSLGKIAMDELDMSHDDVITTASSLFASSTVDDIAMSLNIDVPGGLTDVLVELINVDPTDTESVEYLSKVFTDMATDHADLLDSTRQSDLDAQTNLKYKIDAMDAVTSILPEEDNEVSQTLFKLIATDTFKDIQTTLS